MILECGRPADIGLRLPKEQRVYELLDTLKIDYERVDHAPAETMDACLAIDKVLAPAVICKNIFLCNRQETRFYLLMIREDKKFRTADISKQIGSSRLSFGNAEYMSRFLDITPGSLSVLGLMNDTDNQVQLLVDEDVLQSEQFGCHPCINTSSLRLKTTDVFDIFLRAVHHNYAIVKAAVND